MDLHTVDVWRDWSWPSCCTLPVRVSRELHERIFSSPKHSFCSLSACFHVQGSIFVFEAKIRKRHMRYEMRCHGVCMCLWEHWLRKEWLNELVKIVVFIWVLFFVKFRPYSSNFILRWKRNGHYILFFGIANSIFCWCSKPYYQQFLFNLLSKKSLRMSIVEKIKGLDNPLLLCALPDKLSYPKYCVNVQDCILIVCICDHAVLVKHTVCER